MFFVFVERFKVSLLLRYRIRIYFFLEFEVMYSVFDFVENNDNEEYYVIRVRFLLLVGFEFFY